jgi:ECF transporter S component (folate family)
MNLTHPIQRLTLAAVLTSLSIVIDVISKMLIASPTFGLPFYAIPLILGSIILGPIYGGLMAIIGDTLGVFIAGVGYLPFFVFAPIAWGVIPGLLLKKHFSTFKLLIAVMISYLFATTSNTFAIFFYFGRMAAYSTLALRLVFAIFNTLIIFNVVKDIYIRLLPLHERYRHQIYIDPSKVKA